MSVTNGYVTLAQLKDFIDASEASTVHDADLERIIESASRQIDLYCGRFFYNLDPATAELFEGRDPYELEVDDIYDTTDLVVKTDSDDDGIFETSWTASQYQLEPVNPDDGWPWHRLVAVDTELWPTAGRRARIQITAKWGWTAVPKEIESTCLIVGNELWQRKTATFGIAGFTRGGDVARISASELPALARLDPYRRVQILGV